MSDKAHGTKEEIAPALPQDSQERAIIEASPDGILLVDRSGRILMVNASAEEITGRSKKELLGEPIHVLVPSHLRERHGQWMEQFFASPSPRPMNMASNLKLSRPDGSVLPVDISLGHCARTEASCAVAFVRDISGLRRLEEDMHYQATHDLLTGLANRWQFMQQLELAMAQSARNQRGLALLLLDLDDFKTINDGHGHATGDQVLVEAARRMRKVLRAGDFVARFGGDEFAALLPDVRNAAEIDKLLQRLRDTLAQPFRVNNYQVQMGGSIGMACYPVDASDGETLMRCADMAMYQAKAAGRSAYAVYHPDMSRRLDERMTLHSRLKIALQEEQLQLHYQPQVDLHSGKVTGVEALLRWNDPVLGQVSPERFIPVAESTGMILALGDWVLETACRQQAEWAAQGVPLQVAINLSVQQLRQPRFAERLAELLEKTGAQAERIELEITETEAMAAPDQAVELLDRLVSNGVCLALDDFGTGHSSLSNLRMLPVRRVKIDRSFMQNVPGQASNAALVNAIIGLAHNLGLQAVAEGVETQEQLDFVQAAGCDFYQGWLLAKAMPAGQVAEWMRGL
jgi:diguanylate cyclase (GGDEF)-like protein/PAS domain S-box-containing protein